MTSENDARFAISEEAMALKKLIEAKAQIEGKTIEQVFAENPFLMGQVVAVTKICIRMGLIHEHQIKNPNAIAALHYH